MRQSTRVTGPWAVHLAVLALVCSVWFFVTNSVAAVSGVTLQPLEVSVTPSASAPRLGGTLAPRTGGNTYAGKYDPRTMAVLMNYCRESLCRIVDLSDRMVLDQEYQRLVNNIDVTKIQDDEIANIIGRLMIELNNLKLSEIERGRIAQIYNKKLSNSILESIRGKDVFTKLSSPITLACTAILAAVTAASRSDRAMKQYHRDLDIKTLTIQEQDMKRLAALRSQFFDTEYKLYRRYHVPDRLNLKEVQLEEYIKVLRDENPKRRLERLTRLKDDFDAYPPFWYQIGLAAQESGNGPLALHYYSQYEAHGAPVLREDPDYVMLCMHRIMLLNPLTDRAAIKRDLVSIERNTKYYYKWEDILFAALTYYRIGDLADARRLIQTSINEGYEVPLHQEILVTMESNVARAKLREAQQDLVASTEGNTLGKMALMARVNRLEALRAYGRQLTDISLSVSPRSRGSTNAKFVVPVYNLYLLGRCAIKGDIYLDNCVVHMPIGWFDRERPRVTLVFNGKTHHPSGRSTDKKTGVVDLTFSRVLDQDDVLKKGKEYTCTVVIKSKSGAVTLRFKVQRVTDEILQGRPQLPRDKPYIALKAIEYQGETYKFDNGMILPFS